MENSPADQVGDRVADCLWGGFAPPWI